jgi:hypothetical protein
VNCEFVNEKSEDTDTLHTSTPVTLDEFVEKGKTFDGAKNEIV